MRIFVSFVLTIMFLVIPHPVFAQSPWESQCFAQIGVEKIATIRGIECIVANILNLAIRFIGLALFVMILVGGFKLLTAGGDPKAVESGKQTITLAIGGLIMAIMSWFVLVLISNVTGIGEGLLQFNLNFTP